MKIFNIAFLAVALALAVAATAFNQTSHRADAYMQTELDRSAHATTPHLKPLFRVIYHPHFGRPIQRRVTDTVPNRALYNASWIVAPGDGYLYSAPWVDAIPRACGAATAAAKRMGANAVRAGGN